MRYLLTLFSLLSAGIDLALAETVLGAYIFHRHGDRTTKSWPPTALTALGADQVFTSGSWFRNRYINGTSPILHIASDLVLLSQLSITAPVDNVLQSSSQVFTQGIYPPAGSEADQILADGTSTQAPFSGYQYIPVNIVTSATTSSGAEDTEWLQGSSGCANAVTSSNEYLQSQEYLNYLNKTGSFYQNLLPVYNTTFNSASATFKNAYTSKSNLSSIALLLGLSKYRYIYTFIISEIFNLPFLPTSNSNIDNQFTTMCMFLKFTTRPFRRTTS